MHINNSAFALAEEVAATLDAIGEALGGFQKIEDAHEPAETLRQYICLSRERKERTVMKSVMEFVVECVKIFVIMLVMFMLVTWSGVHAAPLLMVMMRVFSWTSH